MSIERTQLATRMARLNGTREEALIGFSALEARMIYALEQIARLPSSCSPEAQLVIKREIALNALEDVGWPTERDALRHQEAAE